MKKSKADDNIIELYPELALLTRKQVCQLFQIGESKLAELVSAGKIKEYRIGPRCRWFKREEIGAIGGKHG